MRTAFAPDTVAVSMGGSITSNDEPAASSRCRIATGSSLFGPTAAVMRAPDGLAAVRSLCCSAITSPSLEIDQPAGTLYLTRLVSGPRTVAGGPACEDERVAVLVELLPLPAMTTAATAT